MNKHEIEKILEGENFGGSFIITTVTQQKVSAAARKKLGGDLVKVTSRAVIVPLTWDEYQEHLTRTAKALGLPKVPEAKESWHTATEVPYFAKHKCTGKLYLKTFPKEGTKTETYYILPDGSQATYEEIEQYLTPSQRRDYKPATKESEARQATMIRLYKLESVKEIVPLSKER